MSHKYFCNNSFAHLNVIIHSCDLAACLFIGFCKSGISSIYRQVFLLLIK